MDPDIPPAHQRVQFNYRGSDKVAWLVDGNTVGNGTVAGWNPTGGKHRLVLTDAQGNELDAVTFEVRGTLTR